ncbi:MAG: RimK family alpha-L-glutamate ligase [Planctomycetaceae bacterium]|nr:RimK family alpha-L-glutamate ligase [Planctomycetaceae bacterium]
MDVGVLGNPASWYVTDIRRACREQGHVAHRIDFKGLSASERTADSPVVVGRGDDESTCDLTALDAVIVRTMPPGSLEQVVFRMDVLARLESRGITILNPPKAIECAVDKYLATSKLAADGLPVPETVICQDAETAMAALTELGGDVVVKPLFGAEGRGIVRVSDPDLAFRTFRTLERTQVVLYLQRFVEHEGYDIRVLVLDGVVLGAFKRRNPHDFRTNMSRAATGEPHELTDEEHELATRAVRVTGTLFGGVDLLYDRSGRCYVLEVNAVPGWQGFRRVTGIDVAARLITWLGVHVRARH